MSRRPYKYDDENKANHFRYRGTANRNHIYPADTPRFKVGKYSLRGLTELEIEGFYAWVKQISSGARPASPNSSQYLPHPRLQLGPLNRVGRARRQDP